MTMTMYVAVTAPANVTVERGCVFQFGSKLDAVEVFGKSLPNSFLWLSINSWPTDKHINSCFPIPSNIFCDLR